MKNIFSLLFLAVLFIGCNQTKESEFTDPNELAMYETFKRNSETVVNYLNSWAQENVDYSIYSESNFWYRETAFGSPSDSANLEELMVNDKELWANYNFKLLTEPPNLLPGVDAETKRLDGSVRHYIDWEVTRPATDTTDEKVGVIKIYESFDFDEAGKISFQQVYGDFGVLMQFLQSEKK